MDKQAAANLIADTFDSAFTEDRFRFFIRNLIDEIAEFRDSIWITGHIKASFKEHIKKYKRIGKYTDQDGNKLDVIIVHLRKEKALDRARTMQRNFVASYLKTRGEKDAAIVAYLTDSLEDWRFSFVRMEYKQDVTESGRVRVLEELTSARRYSFLVGKNEPNHTAQEQIIPLLHDDQNNPTIEELETAFSVETVTKRFYTDYRGLSEKLVEELDGIIEQDEKIKTEFETRSIDTPNFAKKLLGQIVFLYFVQKKGWLGVGKDDKGNFKHWGTGPKNFLRLLFKKKFIDYKNFFNEVLEPLFYIALATERENDYYDRLDCRTPFLNGGLFEPIKGYNWQETDILISDDLLNEIFDTFDRYNFTVREDEPLEKEVAVDPEMLGKVFENLLPENLRKGKGTYYTPREIVHYMCQESLINYLDTAVNTGEVSLALTQATQEKLFGKPDPEQLSLKTKGYRSIIPRQDIEDFIRKGEFAVEHDIAKEAGTKSYKYQVPASIRNNAQALDEKLSSIKVCDPAIGSGAFPVGMLHEIVKARNVLTTYLKNRTGRSIYDFKRHCIQESLYGVDIDPGAIDIAKLRLWLSLIVDEEDYHTIQPLPNLDYKIMQGNSLIEEFHGISLNLVKEESENENLFAGDNELDHLIETLHEKQNALFNATHVGDKRQLKEAVEKSIVDIFHYELQQQKVPYFKELKNIEETSARFPNADDQIEYYTAEKAKLDKKYNFNFKAVENEMREMTRGNMERNFFPWKLYFADVFRENGGFDVVVANPPYVKENTNKSAFDKLRESECYQGKMDLWYLFGCNGLNILKQYGIMCFIATNNWISNDGASKFRNKVIKNGRIIDFIDFGNYKVFTAGIQTMVYLIAKDSETSQYHLSYGKLIDDKADLAMISNFLSSRTEISTPNFQKYSVVLNRKSFVDTYIKFIHPIANRVLEKIKRWGTFHLAVNEVFSGIDVMQDFVSKKSVEKLGGNFDAGTGVFVISNKEKAARQWNRKELEIIKPYYTTKEINRYYANPDNKFWVLYTGAQINRTIKNYPNIKKHLDQFKNIITSVNKPYGLHRTREEGIFLGDKILSIRKCSRPSFAYVDYPCYVARSFLILKSNRINLKFLLGILNSRLIKFWLYEKGKLQGNLFQVDKVPLQAIPIKVGPKENQNKVVALVEKIIDITKSGEYIVDSNKEDKVKALETEIDQLVYQLYGLTPEEIRIVEGENENTDRAEYAKLEFSVQG